MQNSNPSPNSFTVPFPYCLSEPLARAYVRARAASAGTAPNAGDVFAAFARGDAQPGHHPNEHADAGPGGNADAGASAGQFDVAELAGVMREPIAWVFTLAERRAQGDPVDVAAIHRVRDATLHRVDAIIAGAVASELPRIRAADLLTLAGLLLGTLDPAIVRRALHTLGGGLVEAFGALWPLVPSVANDAADPPGSCAGAYAANPITMSWHCDHLPRRTAPFAVPFVGPYGALLGSPFGGSHVLHIARPAVPPWHWPHAGFPF